MTNVIDELSRMIGAIEADVKHTRNKVESIDRKVDALTEKSIIHESDIQNVKKKINTMQPIIDDYVRNKHVGRAVIATFAAIFGAIGAVATKIAGLLF